MRAGSIFFYVFFAALAPMFTASADLRGGTPPVLTWDQWVAYDRHYRNEGNEILEQSVTLSDKIPGLKAVLVSIKTDSAAHAVNSCTGLQSISMNVAGLPANLEGVTASNRGDLRCFGDGDCDGRPPLAKTLTWKDDRVLSGEGFVLDHLRGSPSPLEIGDLANLEFSFADGRRLHATNAVLQELQEFAFPGSTAAVVVNFDQRGLTGGWWCVGLPNITGFRDCIKMR